MTTAEIKKRARRVRAIVSDVDGVLTDGGILYGAEKLEIKRFHVRDGLGIKLARLAGLKVFLVSGRSSAALRRRSRETGVDRLWQGCVDKRKILDIIKERYGINPREICYLGDDLPDLPLLSRVGLSVAVADAAGELRGKAEIVTKKRGGEGALREVVEIILKAQGKWRDVLDPYRA